jgi:MFS family permease
LTILNHWIDTGQMIERPVRPSLLRNRSFLWFWGGDAISQLGSQFSQLAIPVLAVTLLGASEFEVGVLGAAQTAAFLLVGLPAGAWIDRMLKRRVMITADLVRAACLAAIPALWFAGALQMWHVYLVAAMLGIATVFFDVSYQSYPPILLSGPQIAGANSRLEATAQIARIGGPGLAGALLAAVSAPVLLLADAISYLVSAFALSRVRDAERPSDPAQRQGLAKEIGEGLRFVFGHRLIRRIVGTTATTNFFSMIVFTLEAVLILRELGLEPWVFGLVLSVGSVGGLLGAIATPWITRRIGEGTALSVAAVGFGISILALPLAGTFSDVAIPILIAGTFLESFLVLLYNITQVTMRQRLCPPGLLGRMNASIRCVVWGVMPIGSLLAGVLGTTVGTIPTMWIGAGGTAFGAVFVLFSPLTFMKVLPKELEANQDAAPGEPFSGPAASAEDAVPESPLAGQFPGEDR